jgi:uncharacterized membrane protein YeiH
VIRVDAAPAHHAGAVVPTRKRDVLLSAVDLAATAVFALEGALAGIVAELDVFGVLVIGIVTATAGGVIRDVLIGDVPPASVRQGRYLGAAVLAGAVAIGFQQLVTHIPSWLLTGLDAAGLALFAVAGTAKALDFGLSAGMAAIMGTVTGVGGGTVRDILLNVVPAVLRNDIYAVAALAGAVVMVVVIRIGAARWVAMTAGAVLAFALRVAAAAGDWNLPVPGR